MVDPHYKFDVEALSSLLFSWKENVRSWVGGPTGSGKSTLIEQACAEMKPNKTSSASNENSHEFPPNKKDKDRKLIIFAGRQPLRTFKIYHTKFFLVC